MKTYNLFIVLITALLISNCAKAKFGANQQSSAEGKSIDVAAFAQNKTHSHQLAQSNGSANEFAFLNGANTATYSTTNGTLQISFFNSVGSAISIPDGFASSSEYRETSDFILIALRNADTETGVVVAKRSGHVFIAKDSNLATFDLSFVPSATNATVNGANRAVTEVRAWLSDTAGTSVQVGLFEDNAALYAKRL